MVKKFMIFLILLIIILLAVVGAYFYFNSDSYKLSRCSKLSEPSHRINCFSQIAISKVDVKICDKLLDINEKEYCYSEYAGVSRDLSICNQLSTAVKNVCFTNVALAYGDSAICSENIGKGYVHDCLTKVAIQLNDINPCYSIDYGEDTTYYFDFCVLQVAKASNNKSLCEEIIIIQEQPTKELKDECLSS